MAKQDSGSGSQQVQKPVERPREQTTTIQERGLGESRPKEKR